MNRYIAAGLMLFWATSVAAHSPLEATAPANDSVVAEVPAEIALTFKGLIRLTRVTLTHAGHQSVDLDLGDAPGFISDYVLPLHSFGAGLYEVEWRGLGDDGHAQNGTFSFMVEG